MRQEPRTIRQSFEPPILKIEQIAALVKIPTPDLERLVSDAPHLYSSFEVPKPNGKSRTIRPPKRELRELQRTLLNVLQSSTRYPRWMTGGIPKRSIFHHAKPHTSCYMVATFDVKAFYPNTTPSMVSSVLERFGFGGEAIDAMLRLVTKDNELPQGAPTSGFLANIVLEPADRRIDAVCRKHGFNFTRFVDDLAISGDRDISPFQSVVFQAVEACGYQIAPDKIRYMRRDAHQVVTNLCVNDKLRPTREFIAEVKSDIWDCLNASAAAIAADRGVQLHVLKNSLTGKVSHIRAADPAMGDKLRKLLYGVDWNRVLDEPGTYSQT